MLKKKNSSKRVIGSGPYEIFIEAFGREKNPCILLIPGMMSCAEFFSDTFCNELSLEFFTIRLDLRDMGRSSSVLYETSPYTMEDLTKDILAVLDHFHIKKAHLIGHAFGGQLCQSVALLHQARVLSITLLCSMPISATKIDSIPLSDGEKAALNKTQAMLLSQNEKDESSFHNSFLEIWRYLNGSYPFNEKMAEAYLTQLKQFLDKFSYAKNNYEKVMQKMRSSEKLKIEDIAVETHVIHGNEDPLSLPRNGRALALCIPNAKLDMVEGMGHVFFNKDLEHKLCHLVLNFIKKLRGDEVGS